MVILTLCPLALVSEANRRTFGGNLRTLFPRCPSNAGITPLKRFL
jgi:hypothetical protein